MSKQKTFLSKNSNATAVSAKTSLRASATSWRIWSRKRQKSALAGNRRVESEFVTLRGTRCQVSVAAAAAFEWKLDETESSQFRNRPKKAARQRVREKIFERSYARKAKSAKVWNSFAEKKLFLNLLRRSFLIRRQPRLSFSSQKFVHLGQHRFLQNLTSVEIQERKRKSLGGPFLEKKSTKRDRWERKTSVRGKEKNVGRRNLAENAGGKISAFLSKRAEERVEQLFANSEIIFIAQAEELKWVPMPPSFQCMKKSSKLRCSRFLITLATGRVFSLNLDSFITTATREAVIRLNRAAFPSRC